MRIHPAVLFVLIGISIPFIIQSRTVAHYAGIDMTAVHTLILGIVVIGAMIVYAFLPNDNST